MSNLQLRICDVYSLYCDCIVNDFTIMPAKVPDRVLEYEKYIKLKNLNELILCMTFNSIPDDIINVFIVLWNINTSDILLHGIKKNPWEIGFINKYYLSFEICNEAVKRDGLMLYYIQNQTHELCLNAVKRSRDALKYVKNQTIEICLEAVKHHGTALQYVKNQTNEICLAAINRDSFALQYVKNQTDEICLAAVKQNPEALEYVKNQTRDICMAAVKKNGFVICYVRDKTIDLIIEAMKNNCHDALSNIYPDDIRCDYTCLENNPILINCLHVLNMTII